MQEELKEIKTVKMTEKGQICIPHTVRKIKGFEEGSKINILVYQDRVELRPMKKGKISDAMMAMLASQEALAKNWLSKEDEEAWKDL